jgi:hypothetical protein
MLKIALVLLCAFQAPATKPRDPAQTAPANTPKPNVAAATPEQALRTFLIAMLDQDAETLRAVTLPTDDFDVLLAGPRPPAEQLEQIKAQMKAQPIKTLKAGETFTLPGNRKATIKPEEVTPDRAVLLPEQAPLPTRLRKVDGRWKVDAAPMIAGRKAAEAARKKQTDPNR